MDARELTKKFYELENIICDYRKRIEYLEDVNRKMEMRLKDLEVDVRMNNDTRRCNNG